MKKLLLLPALLLPLTLFAKIWIVDSNPGSASKDFVNLQEAHDGASAGDTLYLIGSITTKVTINKRLIIIGPGYFLNNPETQVSLAAAFLRLATDPCNAGVEFATGSEGSAIMGVSHAGNIAILTNNIMIKRNLFYDNKQSCSGSNRITISGSAVSILQNYIEPNQNSIAVRVNAGFNNIRINNNFAHGTFEAFISIGSSGEIINNLIVGGVIADNTLVQNNISFAVPVNGTFNNCTVRNNIAAGSAAFPSGNGNILNVAQSDIFLGIGTVDSRWKLKDGSPAIGSGFEGVDMGMFGGDEPYVLSGIPPIPTIYQLNAPAVGEKNTGLPITVKAKANN